MGTSIKPINPLISACSAMNHCIAEGPPKSPYLIYFLDLLSSHTMTPSVCIQIHIYLALASNSIFLFPWIYISIPIWGNVGFSTCVYYIYNFAMIIILIGLRYSLEIWPEDFFEKRTMGYIIWFPLNLHFNYFMSKFLYSYFTVVTYNTLWTPSILLPETVL